MFSKLGLTDYLSDRVFELVEIKLFLGLIAKL